MREIILFCLFLQMNMKTMAIAMAKTKMNIKTKPNGNMKTLLKALLVVVAMCCVTTVKADRHSYENPVIRKNFPDPTIIKHDDGYYYAYCTGNYVPIYRSKNLVNWASVGNAFNSTTRPQFVEGAGIWAPDINKIGDKYVMFFSMSTWGGEWSCGIGCAWSDSPYSTFHDAKKLFISSEIGVQNSIDPFYIEDEDGKKYLFWGSFRDIYGIELSDDGLSLKEGAEKFKIAGGLIEGTYIHKRGEYYYLIGSAGSCCDGANSTYHLVVARSKSIKGPYVSKNGGRATSNSFDTILSKDPDFVYGPGHCSEIVTDEAGQDWICYHGYQASDVDKGRCMYLDRVMWDSEGWPYFNGDKPTQEWDRPVIEGYAVDYTYSDVEYIDFTGPNENYKYLFDTGYVPSKSTKLDFDCYSYTENSDEEPFVDEKWRAICSGRNSYNDGISIYVNPEGDKFGYFVGGYVNNGLTNHEFEHKYHIEARLTDITIDGTTFTTNRSVFTKTTQRLTLFSGLQDYPYFGRIYGMKVYAPSTKLLHDYVPVLRNEDEMPMFYDKVDEVYIRPHIKDGFGVGPVVDAIKNVETTQSTDNALYDLRGIKVNDDNPKPGIYIRNGKKIVL